MPAATLVIAGPAVDAVYAAGLRARAADPDHLRGFGQECTGPVSGFMDLGRDAGVLDAALPCYRAPVSGLHPNRDFLAP